MCEGRPLTVSLTEVRASHYEDGAGQATAADEGCRLVSAELQLMTQSLQLMNLTAADTTDVSHSVSNKRLHLLSSLLSPSLHFNGHFPGGPGLADTRMSPFLILLELRMMEVVVTGAIRRVKLQQNRQHQQTNTQLFTGHMPFAQPTALKHHYSYSLNPLICLLV